MFLTTARLFGLEFGGGKPPIVPTTNGGSSLGMGDRGKTGDDATTSGFDESHPYPYAIPASPCAARFVDRKGRIRMRLCELHSFSNGSGHALHSFAFGHHRTRETRPESALVQLFVPAVQLFSPLRPGRNVGG